MPRWSLEPWRSEDVHWGVTPCHFCHALEPAELLIDGVPASIDCADLFVERQKAISLHESMRELLPLVGT